MPLMTESLIDLVRRGYRAWNDGDREWVLARMAEDVEWTTPPEDPEPGTYRGHRGVERFWDQWAAAVGRLIFHPVEVIEAGEHVIVTARREGTGEHSGLNVSDRVTQVFTFRGDGLCAKVGEFYDPDDALRSVGIEPENAPDPIPISEAGA